MRRRPLIANLFIPIAGAPAAEPRWSVFVKITEKLMPVARGEKYEDPLDAELKIAKLGEVTGGGTNLSKEHGILWIGIDVELTDLERGVPFLQQALRKLGAPRGSTIEYERFGRKVEVPVHE
jgi:hypothetical protein